MVNVNQKKNKPLSHLTRSDQNRGPRGSESRELLSSREGPTTLRGNTRSSSWRVIDTPLTKITHSKLIQIKYVCRPIVLPLRAQPNDNVENEQSAKEDSKMSSGARRRLRSVVVFLRGKKREKNSVSLSLFLGRSSNLCFGLFFPSVFLPLHSFARGYLPALSFLSLSLSDYHRSKSTRSLSKRWCVLFSMIRFCFFCSLALAFVRICLSKVYVRARERFLSIARVSWMIGRTFSLLSLSFSLSLSLAHTRNSRGTFYSLSLFSLSIHLGICQGKSLDCLHLLGDARGDLAGVCLRLVLRRKRRRHQGVDPWSLHRRLWRLRHLLTVRVRYLKPDPNGRQLGFGPRRSQQLEKV